MSATLTLLSNILGAQFPFLFLSPFTISNLRNGHNVRTTAQGVRSPEVKGKKAGCPVIATEVVDRPDLHNETLS